MLDDIAFVLIAVFVLALSTCTRPVRAQCPEGWRHHGVGWAHPTVRPVGAFECDPYAPAENEPITRTGRGPTIAGRIYCPQPTRPVVIDDRTVACRRER